MSEDRNAEQVTGNMAEALQDTEKLDQLKKQFNQLLKTSC